MAFYLFPGVMADRLYTNVSKVPAYQLYYLLTKQYLGLGFLLQYVPFTNANKARQQLSNELAAVIEKYKNDTYGSGSPSLLQRMKDSEKSYYLNFSPLAELWQDIIWNSDEKALFKHKNNFNRQYWLSFPFVNDILQVNLFNLLESIVNPFKPLEELVTFIQKGIYNLIDIGSHTESGNLRYYTKGFVGLVAGIIKAPVKIGKHAVDLILTGLATILINPVAHLASSLYQAYEHRNDQVLVATIQELRTLKEVRLKAKNSLSSSYSDIKQQTSENRDYIGADKKDLYNQELDDKYLNNVVAISGSKGDMKTRAVILAELRGYKGSVPAKDKPEFIQNIRQLTSLGSSAQSS